MPRTPIGGPPPPAAALLAALALPAAGSRLTSLPAVDVPVGLGDGVAGAPRRPWDPDEPGGLAQRLSFLKDNSSECPLGLDGRRVGCWAASCRCGWGEQCYPTSGHAGHQAGEGICDASLPVLVSASLLLLVAVVVTVVVGRMLLQWREMALEAELQEIAARNAEVKLWQGRLHRGSSRGAGSATGSRHSSTRSQEVVAGAAASAAAPAVAVTAAADAPATATLEGGDQGCQPTAEAAA